MRVAVIQIGIPLQSYTRDLVNGLSDAGVDVVVISSNSEDWGLIGLSTLKCDVKLVQLDALRHLLYRRIRPKIASFCGFHLAASPRCIHEKVLDYLREIPPIDLVIGVEKEGLDVAARCAGVLNIPYVYYSLELYLEDHPNYKAFHWQRRSEVVNHQGAAATIIQDKYRWGALRTANGINDRQVFYLPVGITPRPACDENPGVDPVCSFTDRKIMKLLYLGYLMPNRFLEALAQHAEQFPSSIRVHLHGPTVNRKLEDWARDRAQCLTLKITTDLLQEHDMANFVRGFDIGLALYLTTNVNDRTTAFSSQKIALYLSESKPIITFRSESYEALFAKYVCGVMIDSLDELQQAVEKIMSNYSMYASEAKRAFAEVYNLNNYWTSLVEFLSAIVVRDRVRINSV